MLAVGGARLEFNPAAVLVIVALKFAANDVTLLSADQGHVVAQATLGAYYWAGRGVPQDLVKAYFWSVLAQSGGDEASKYRVAVLASRMNRSQITAAQQLANDWIKEHQSVSQNAASAGQKGQFSARAGDASGTPRLFAQRTTSVTVTPSLVKKLR